MKKILLVLTLILCKVGLLAQPNIQWQKSLGGSSQDEGYSVKQTFDGGYIVVGSSNSNNGDVTGNNGTSDYWVAKLNSSGIIQWQKSLGKSNRKLSHAEVLNRDYYRGRFASNLDGKFIYNWEELDF